MLSKKKNYNDSQLFVDGMQFLKASNEIFENVSKDNKIRFGNDFIINIRDMIICFSTSYKHTNSVEKLQYALDAKRLLDTIDIMLRIMTECNVLTIKQSCSLQLTLGNIMIQLTGWIQSISSKKTNGSLETQNGCLN